MKFATFLMAACVSTLAFSQDTNEIFAKCGATKDGKARLACYDKLQDDIQRANKAAAAAPVPKYFQIDLVDLKVDLKKLNGKKVAVSAAIQSMGGFLALKTGEMDLTPIFVVADDLPREDRKKLADRCQLILCRGQFFGRIGQSPMGPAVILEAVEWR